MTADPVRPLQPPDEAEKIVKVAIQLSRVTGESVATTSAALLAVTEVLDERDRLRAERDALQQERDELGEEVRSHSALSEARRCALVDAAAERDALAEAVREALELHQPKSDGRGSLVSWAYCSCGAMETFTADDGYLSIGPARHPCATRRALAAVPSPNVTPEEKP